MNSMITLLIVGANSLHLSAVTALNSCVRPPKASCQGKSKLSAQHASIPVRLARCSLNLEWAATGQEEVSLGLGFPLVRLLSD